MEKLFFDDKQIAEQNYYEVLNSRNSSSKEQITTEYRFLCKQYHPDRITDGIQNTEDSEQYYKITKAYEVLSNEKQRKDYDKWMGSGLSVSYERWKQLSAVSHTSLHWGTRKSQLALEEGEDRNKSETETTTSTTITSTKISTSKSKTTTTTATTSSTSPPSNKRSAQSTIPSSRRLVSKFRKYQI